MTPPTTYRIADKAPEFPCWLWHQGNRLMRPGWYDSRTMIRSWLPAPDHTHWCHSAERPTHDPTAPATPATSAAKGGDIPRTPTDSEMLDWVEDWLWKYHPETVSHLRIWREVDSSGKLIGPETFRGDIAAAMQKGVRG